MLAAHMEALKLWRIKTRRSEKLQGYPVGGILSLGRHRHRHRHGDRNYNHDHDHERDRRSGIRDLKPIGHRSRD